MSNSCKDDKNILNSDCLIANNNKLLANKKLRWIIYQNVNTTQFDNLDDFIENVVPDDILPYSDIMSFNDKLPDKFINKPATVFIIDGFLMSSMNKSFNLQINGTGYILVLFEDIDNLIDYSNIQTNQIILAVDTTSSSPKVGDVVNAQTYTTKNINLKANILYRISIVHYQNNPIYTGLNIRMNESGQLKDLEENILFSYANDTSINNTLIYKNNNNVLNGYLKWDYFSQDKGNYKIENYTDPNIKPPNTLAIFKNDPLNIDGLFLNKRTYVSKINLEATQVSNIGHKPYFKYIIDGFITLPQFYEGYTLNLNVFGGYVMILLLKVNFDPMNNILDVTNEQNILFCSSNTDGNYIKSKLLQPGMYRIQIIFTSGNVNNDDIVGFMLGYNSIYNENVKEIPKHWLSTEYLIDYKSEYNNAILSNCGINDADWYTTDGCLEAINNDFLNELDLRNNNSKKFRDLIASDCKDITEKNDSLLFNICKKYQNPEIHLDKCFDANYDIINDEACLVLTGSNKILYQKYLDNCSMDVKNFDKQNCKKFANTNNINLYDMYCAASNVLNEDKKKYIESDHMYNFCRANMSDNFKDQSDVDLFNYCNNDTNLFKDDICKNLKDLNKIKLEKCFKPGNIDSTYCKAFITNPENLGMVSENIIEFCTDHYDNPICSNFYNDEQKDENIKNDYYMKIVNTCSDLSKNNNFITPNTSCYNIANNTNIDSVTNRSPASYFTKEIINYCSRGKNILTAFCQNKYNNIKDIVKPAIKSNFTNNDRNYNYYNDDKSQNNIIYINDIYDYDIGNDDVFIFIYILIGFLLFILLFIYIYKKYLKIEQKCDYFLTDEMYKFLF